MYVGANEGLEGAAEICLKFREKNLESVPLLFNFFTFPKVMVNADSVSVSKQIPERIEFKPAPFLII
jgi:hypothetical protein